MALTAKSCVGYFIVDLLLSWLLARELSAITGNRRYNILDLWKQNSSFSSWMNRLNKNKDFIYFNINFIGVYLYLRLAITFISFITVILITSKLVFELLWPVPKPKVSKIRIIVWKDALCKKQ